MSNEFVFIDEDKVFNHTNIIKQDYGGTAYGKTGIMHLGPYNGYDPLLVKIIEFFKSGIPPVEKVETLEKKITLVKMVIKEKE